ncbi:MAG: Ig-like domain repeat protein [Azonexus sp.]
MTYYDKALRWWNGSAWVPVYAAHVPDVTKIVPPPPGSVDTTTTLVSSSSSPVPGSVITLTATVSGGATGSVAFDYWDGSVWQAISTDTASPWQATHTITGDTIYRARYLGATGFNASTSANLSVVVAVAAATTTVLTMSDTDVNSGTAVTMTATVSGAPSEGSAQFQFYESGVWTNYGGTPVVTAGKATISWASPNRTLAWRVIYSGGPSYLGSTSASVTLTVRTQKTTTKTVLATWTACYQQDGDKRAGILEAYQGYYSSTNGNQRSLIGFPALGLPAGSTISKVELYIYAAHWGDSGGGTGVFGWHGYSAAPASYVTGGNPNQTQVAWSSKTGAKWVTMAAACNAGFASGANKGIIVGPGPSTNTLAYYGYFNGNGQANEPQLRVTYSYWS